MVRIAQIRSMDISNGTGIGISIWTQGCPYHCKNCHNPQTWSMDSGKEIQPNEESELLELIKKDYITRLSILGGEPFLPRNVKYLANLIYAAKQIKPNIKIWLWTGSTFEALYNLATIRGEESFDKILESLDWSLKGKNELEYILNNLDYMIDGRFIQEQKDLTLKFRGSKNQRILDMPASMSAGKAILADI